MTGKKTVPLFKCLISLMLALSITPQKTYAALYPWPTTNEGSGRFVFLANDQSLRRTFVNLANTYGVKVYFSETLPESILDSKLSGNFNEANFTSFLDKISKNFGFSWFYHAGILYFTSNQFVTEKLYVDPSIMGNIKMALEESGVLDDKFGWSELPTTGNILVSGPQEYVNIIKNEIATFNVSSAGQQFAIFRLSYASAADIKIELSSKQLVIPGIATILKSLLRGNENVTPGVDNRVLKQVIEPLKKSFPLEGVSPSSAGEGNPSASGPSSQASNNGNIPAPVLSSPIIEADARLNSIIIRDKSSNIEVYRNIIKLLDVPSSLIQVDAVIIDVDQSKFNEAGINWGVGTSSGASVGFGANQPQAAAEGTFVASFNNVSPGNLIISNLTSFFTSLKFLETQGAAKTQSRSAVVTLDNLAANIDLKESVYVVNQPSASGANTGLGQVDSNMSMQITPHIILEEGVQRIKLTISLQDGNIESRMVNGLPVTIQGSLSSQAVINEGQALLMAGYSRNQNIEVENAVPILSKIPILGWLFRRTNTENRKFQREYMIIPKILTPVNLNPLPDFSAVSVGGQTSPTPPKEKKASEEQKAPEKKKKASEEQKAPQEEKSEQIPSPFPEDKKAPETGQ